MKNYLMSFDFLNLFLGMISSTGLIGIIAYVLRDTVAKFFTKAVETRFEKRLELFKTEIRNNEKELEQIRSFLVATAKDRDSALQNKRLEAAETLLKARTELSSLSMLVDYMKILKSDVLLDAGADAKICDFINTLIKPFDLDAKLKQLNSIDKVGPHLYLMDQTLKHFEAYESIILHAASMMKIFSSPISGKRELIKTGKLSEQIMKLVPNAKPGFDEWGDDYAYQWAQYFYDEILRSLRHEVSGLDDLSRAAKAVEDVALTSREAQIRIIASARQADLPSSIINLDGKML